MTNSHVPIAYEQHKQKFMQKQNKNSVYSISSLVLTILSYVILDKFINSDSSLLGNRFVDKFDWFIYSSTNHQWEFTSIYIIYFLFFAVPFIFLALSTFFGIKALKDRETASPKIRMLGLVSLTISSFILLTFIVLGVASLAGF